MGFFFLAKYKIYQSTAFEVYCIVTSGWEMRVEFLICCEVDFVVPIQNGIKVRLFYVQ